MSWLRNFRQTRLKTFSAKRTMTVSVIAIVTWETKQVPTMKPSALILVKVYGKGTESAEA